MTTKIQRVGKYHSTLHLLKVSKKVLLYQEYHPWRTPVPFTMKKTMVLSSLCVKIKPPILDGNICTHTHTP